MAASFDRECGRVWPGVAEFGYLYRLVLYPRYKSGTGPAGTTRTVGAAADCAYEWKSRSDRDFLIRHFGLSGEPDLWLPDGNTWQRPASWLATAYDTAEGALDALADWLRRLPPATRAAFLSAPSPEHPPHETT